MRLLTCLAILAIGMIGVAAEPALPLPVSPKVVFPSGPVNPAPQPGSAIVLPAGQLYVIHTDLEIDVDVIPEGIVSVISKTGPRDITAKFVDGTGEYEDRTFNAKNIVILKALKTGRVTVTVVPVGSRKSDWLRRELDCFVGPPPKPPAPPAPPEPPKPPGPAVDAALRDRLKTAYTKDTGTPKAKDGARQDLAELYSQFADATSDKMIGTTDTLRAKMKKLAEGISAGQLPVLRNAIADEIDAILTEDGPLSDDLRKKIADLFIRISLALSW